jgi:hypothetical protein
MPSKHGTRQRYSAGCRCDDCKDSQRLYQQRYRERKTNGDTRLHPTAVAQITQVVIPAPSVGRVEAGVIAEIEGLAQAEVRPGLANAALELARLMDNPKATNQKPAAAAKLADLLDKLRKGADERKSRLASVRAMTSVKTG